MVVVIIILVIVVLLAMYLIGLYNNLVSKRNYVNESFSTMDIYLKKRFDLIPNLVAVVKQYSKFEGDTLEKIVMARSKGYAGMSIEEKADTDKQVTGALSKFIAVAESYPELKANEQYNNLTKELSSIEVDIANSRKYYNGTARDYNTAIMVFPAVIFAGMLGFKAYKLFEIAQVERENVKVDFDAK